jgi:(p)ppGpp synthase/HD superfamily hydrolase
LAGTKDNKNFFYFFLFLLWGGLPMKFRKNTSQRTFLFGDYDKDRVKNVDDAYPFNPKKHDSMDNTRAQLSNSETPLSMALLSVQRKNNQLRPGLLAFKRKYPGSEGRIKTVSSTLYKLQDRYLMDLGDRGGVRILTSNRKKAYSLQSQIFRKEKVLKGGKDDYYKHPKGGFYYGLHSYLDLGKGKRLELQIKSTRMQRIADSTHPYYKRGLSPPKSLKLYAKKSYKLGF